MLANPLNLEKALALCDKIHLAEQNGDILTYIEEILWEKLTEEIEKRKNELKNEPKVTKTNKRRKQ